MSGGYARLIHFVSGGILFCLNERYETHGSYITLSVGGLVR